MVDDYDQQDISFEPYFPLYLNVYPLPNFQELFLFVQQHDMQRTQTLSFTQWSRYAAEDDLILRLVDCMTNEPENRFPTLSAQPEPSPFTVY
jgi:hypothetical protein